MIHKQAATTNKANQNQNNTTTHTYIHTYMLYTLHITHFTSLPILYHLASGENTMKEEEKKQM